MTFDAYVMLVRERLCLLGVPMNRQPPREEFHVWHARGWPSDDCARYYAPRRFVHLLPEEPCPRSR